MGNTNSIVKQPEEQSFSKCPVKQDSKTGCPVKQDSKPGCPVKHTKKSSSYNVYNEKIDETNFMPVNPNQEPKDGQKFPLDTNRVTSSIPKGGSDSTWSYPSEQMFFNAMRRKGKASDVHEGDVPTIVAIHNNMNEKTWNQVLEYEANLFPTATAPPKLLRFLGRPDDLTPLAWMRRAIGWGKPFDRHDWHLIRHDGSEKRYVIDYYYNESTHDKVPESLYSADSIKSITMYARPAVDAPSDVLDRCRYHVNRFLSSTDTSLEKKTTSKVNVENPVVMLDQAKVSDIFEKIQQKCSKQLENIKSQSEAEASSEGSKTAINLQHCMATIICSQQAEDFTNAIASGNETTMAKTFDAMTDKIEAFELSAQQVMRQEAVSDASKQ